MFENLKILISNKRKFYNLENNKIEVIKLKKNKLAIRNIQGFKWLVLYSNLMLEKWYKINRLYTEKIGGLLFYVYKITPD